MRNYDDDDRAVFHAKLRRWATAVALMRERYRLARTRAAEAPNAWQDHVPLPRF